MLIYTRQQYGPVSTLLGFIKLKSLSTGKIWRSRSWFGHRLAVFSLTSGLTKLTRRSGANALAVLREIGVYEDLMKYMPDPTKANMAAINCVFGNDGHENIYAVSAFAHGRMDEVMILC